MDSCTAGLETCATMTAALQQRPLLWQSLTWEEIAELRRSGMNLCLLPVGATEQHGPHLGVGMDSCNATLLCEAVSRGTGAPVLPTLSYGCSLGHSHRWPGTIALQPLSVQGQAGLNVAAGVAELILRPAR